MDNFNFKGNKQGFIPLPHDQPTKEMLKEKEEMLKGMKENNDLLKSKLAALNDSKDLLEKEIKKLRRDLEDSKGEADDRNKWRRKALDLEGNLGDVQDQLESLRKRNKKKEGEKQEEVDRLEREVRRFSEKVKEKEKEIREMSHRKNDSKADLEDLLRKMRDNSGDANQNKELLHEIMKKIDELNKRSSP